MRSSNLEEKEESTLDVSLLSNSSFMNYLNVSDIILILSSGRWFCEPEFRFLSFFTFVDLDTWLLLFGLNYY